MTGAPVSDPEDGEPLPVMSPRVMAPWPLSGGRPLRLYFLALISVFVFAAVGAVAVVHIQVERDAREDSANAGRFAARVAAKQLSDDFALVRSTVTSLARNPGIVKTINQPAGCSLTFATGGAADRGYIDILRSDGRTVCSSRAAQGQLGSHAGAAWLRKARSQPTFAAPFVDSTLRAPVAVVSAPVPGHGVVAAFIDLRAVGPKLAAAYGAGRGGEFLVTTADGRRVLARSIRPNRSVGSQLAGMPFTQSRGMERSDLEGKTRYYSGSSIPGPQWRVYVGEEKAAVLASAGRLERTQLTVVLVSLVAVLVGALVVYRRVAEPIKEMSASVGAITPGEPWRPLRMRGPSEVVALAGAMNSYLALVDRELEERLRAEEQLHALAAIVESSGDAITGKALDGTITSWNSGAVQMYGYTSEEAVGRNIDMLVPPEHRAEFSPVLDSLARGETINGFETKRVRKNGTMLDVSLTMSPVRGAHGEIIGASTIGRDVTAHRRAEAELRQAQKMEAIGSLASGVAHDFNNILMVIRTCGALLLKRLDREDRRDQELRADVMQIDEAAQRAAQLTQQLLSLARQEVVRREVTDLNAAAQETLRLLNRLIGENIEIKTDLSPGLNSIVADHGQLVQVILNLAVNARDAMSGGGTLTIRTANVEVDEPFATQHAMPPGRYTMLQLTDTGAGMDAETKSRVFDPFFTTKDIGTGLGLATVFGIVKQTDGHIWLYSEPGMGTTFKVYFPSTQRLLGGDGTSPPKDRPLEGTETILLVEDEQAVRPLVATALRSYGYNVLEAANAAEALQVVEQQESPIDLLLTDVVMPGMNGRELAECLIAEQPSLHILYTSGYPADTIIRHGITHANTAFLEKPYLPHELVERIRVVLDDTPASRIGA